MVTAIHSAFYFCLLVISLHGDGHHMESPEHLASPARRNVAARSL